MKTPEEDKEGIKPAPLGIYTEVDTNAIVTIAGLSNDGEQHEYNVATCGRTDPNAPPPLPRDNTDYSSLERSDLKENHVPSPANTSDDSHVPVPYEEVVPTTATNTDSPKPQRDLSKKPPVPSFKPKLVKPPVPNKPMPLKEATPPKPKRTYVTNIAQPQTSNDSLSSQSPPSTSITEDKKSFKPMPLPRRRGSEEIEVVGNEVGKTLAKSESAENSDSPPTEPQDNPKRTPLAYAYVDIDIPDSPRDLSSQLTPALATANTEPLSPPTANIAVKNNIPPSRTGATKQEGKTAGPPPVGAYKSKRRTPPPPPPTKPVKPVPLQEKPTPQIKPASRAKPPPPPKPADSSKAKSLDMKSVHVLPNPTPAKPIQRRFWLFSKKTVPAPVPITSKNAGNTPPTFKRRGSVKKVLFRSKRSASQGDSLVETTEKPAVIIPADVQSSKTAREEERSDSPDFVGYDVVGIKVDSTTSKSSPNAKVRLLPCLYRLVLICVDTCVNMFGNFMLLKPSGCVCMVCSAACVSVYIICR